MNESKEYTIVRLNKENIKDLAILHSEVYSTKTPNEYFRKKYHTAYTGVEYVGFLAYNNVRHPIAYYGVVPCFIYSENELILAAQSTDTMTHQEFRYKGMFVELSNLTFNLCRELNVKLIFGFPNENSYHGAIFKLGWIETEKMNLFTIPVKAMPLFFLLKKFSGLTMQKISLPLKGVDNSIIQDGFAGVYRSEDYLLYKTYTPTKVLKIGDCKVWISTRNNLLIGDIKGINKNNFPDVIRRLRSIAKKIGVKKIQFLCCRDTSLNKLFEGSYKAERSFPVLFQDFGSPVPLHKIKFTLADIDIF